MTRILAAALAAALAFALAAHAQTPQKPEAKPETPQEPAKAQDAKPEPGQEPDPKIMEGILKCLAEGLPQGWAKTWFVINEIGRDATGATRRYEATFHYAMTHADMKGRPFKPCGADPILEGVGALNEYLPDGQRRWTGAKFTIYGDGKYEAQYDYTPRKPAAKPAAKKKQDAKK